MAGDSSNTTSTPTPTRTPTPTPTPTPSDVGQVSISTMGQTSASQVILSFVTTEPRPFVVQSKKFEKFSGSNFKRWQQKMLVYLMMLHLARFLLEDLPAVDKNDTDTTKRVAYDQWGQGDFL
ncbi:hypothetical protein ACS0TY_023305 [Phlomoides rotata]